MLIFFALVLIVYTSVNYYIFRRASQSLSDFPSLRKYFMYFMLFVILSYPIGRTLEGFEFYGFSLPFIWIGSFWLAFMLYIILHLAIIDLLRWVLKNNHYIKSFRSHPHHRFLLFLLVVFISSTVIVGGHLNAISPSFKEIDINIEKEIPGTEKIKIAVVSDIHMSAVIGNQRVKRIVNAINSTAPDLILIPGDIVDQKTGSIIWNKAGEPLKELKSTFGIYGVTGNHEFIGGVEQTSSYIEKHGVKLLRDSYTLTEPGLYIVGREDLTSSRFSEIRRKDLHQLLIGVDKSKPIILLDHQPFFLDSARVNGIDLQLSGHTHHGQLWPTNFITEMIYELSWGYLRKGNTHYYVSSGVGGWGPPVRTGSPSEIVLINLYFRK